MCERTCPRCGSTEHFEGYGIIGAYMLCEGCGVTLAQAADVSAAPTDLSESEAVAWAAERTFVLAGAEARNPAQDAIWSPPTSGGGDE